MKCFVSFGLISARFCAPPCPCSVYRVFRRFLDDLASPRGVIPGHACRLIPLLTTPHKSVSTGRVLGASPQARLHARRQRWPTPHGDGPCPAGCSCSPLLSPEPLRRSRPRRLPTRTTRS